MFCVACWMFSFSLQFGLTLKKMRRVGCTHTFLASLGKLEVLLTRSQAGIERSQLPVLPWPFSWQGAVLSCLPQSPPRPAVSSTLHKSSEPNSSMCVCVGGGWVVPTTTEQCSRTSWGSYNSTGFSLCLPRVSVRSRKTALSFPLRC